MENKGRMAVGGAGKRKRAAADFYPTPREVTVALMKHLCILKGTKVWEPACGQGHMAKVFEEWDLNVVATDLHDRGYGRLGVDFLKVQPKSEEWDGWIITNPPFKPSAEFIRHAASFNPLGFAMLLKSQYWHAASRVQLFADIRPSEILPLTWRPDFMEGKAGNASTMDVMWVVWRRGDFKATYRPLMRPKEVFK